VTRLVLALALIGCGNHGGASRPTPPPPGDAAVAIEPGPSDGECDALIDHAIELQTPPHASDAGVASDERTKLRGEVRDRVLTRCRAMPRATYRCAMAATTIDAFTGCDRE
jgi:hypothetical protein